MAQIPTATYRIQFNPDFGFHTAQKLIPYLGQLGISHIYASPVFKARKGSPHGYDIVDPNELNPELGGCDGFEDLTMELKAADMGYLQDIVPNHMAYDSQNAMLMDVIENGVGSQYFHFFDIDWRTPLSSERGRLLAPFLERSYPESLDSGEITLVFDDNGLGITYRDLRFPVKIESYLKVLEHDLDSLKNSLGSDHPELISFTEVLDRLRSLPTIETVDARYNQTERVKQTLRRLYDHCRELKRYIDASVERFNGTTDDARSRDLLDDLLSEQLFRLAFWKTASEEINYRRFFHINRLISLRTQNQQVFDHTHDLIFRLIGKGAISGLRVDHIDGLYDPAGYLKRLRERAQKAYIVVEKILEAAEDLPPVWPIEGTTGYDFLNHVNGVLCDSKNSRTLSRIYSRFSGADISYDHLVVKEKRMVIQRHMAAEIDGLARMARNLLIHDGHGRDITLDRIRDALAEVMACFPVYRTYIDHDGPSEADRHHIKEAVRKALHRSPGHAYELNLLKRLLLPDLRDPANQGQRKQVLDFVLRFQQFTGPLMAKGFEDTVLYIYNRLLSLNEVGGNPDRFGISIGEFHDFNQRRARSWPHSLSAASTHDTKRGEDVRARLNVLSEIPREWEDNIKAWRKLTRDKTTNVGGIRVPDKNDEYFLYQTLVGAFPFDDTACPNFVERIRRYMVKVAREAKVHTTWREPDAEYENALVSFAEKILEPSEHNEFLKEFLPFQKKVAHYGILNSLSQTLLKMCSPGVPDFYQGTELWDLNLVDPDNRRPVDFEKRMMYLDYIEDRAGSDIQDLIAELLSAKEDGRLKLFLIYRVLGKRKEKMNLFESGAYVPIPTMGRFKRHVIAFARTFETDWAISIAPRLMTTLVKEGDFPLGREVWDDTRLVLPTGIPATWKDAITDRLVKADHTLLVGDVLEDFPVALLVGRKGEL